MSVLIPISWNCACIKSRDVIESEAGEIDELELELLAVLLADVAFQRPTGLVQQLLRLVGVVGVHAVEAVVAAGGAGQEEVVRRLVDTLVKGVDDLLLADRELKRLPHLDVVGRRVRAVDHDAVGHAGRRRHGRPGSCSCRSRIASTSCGGGFSAMSTSPVLSAFIRVEASGMMRKVSSSR